MISQIYPFIPKDVFLTRLKAQVGHRPTHLQPLGAADIYSKYHNFFYKTAFPASQTTSGPSWAAAHTTTAPLGWWIYFINNIM